MRTWNERHDEGHENGMGGMGRGPHMINELTRRHEKQNRRV